MRRTLRALPVAALAAVAGLAPSPAAAATPAFPGVAYAHSGPVPAAPVAGGGEFTVKVYGDVDETAQAWFGDVPGTEQRAAKNRVICLPVVGFPCDPTAFDGWIIRGKLPAHAAGKVDVTVRVGDRVIAGQSESSDDFVYYEEPRIVSIAPANGPASGGNTVKINLEGLLIKDPVVTFGDETATVLDSVQTGGGPGSATQTVSVSAPAGSADEVVDVKVAGIVDRGVPQRGTAVGATETTDDYTYSGFGDLAPRVTSVAGVGYAWVGGLAVIRGVRFGGPATTVKVGGKTAFVLSKTSTQLVIFAPPLAKGTHPVTVTNADGVSSPSAASTLTYRALR